MYEFPSEEVKLSPEPYEGKGIGATVPVGGGNWVKLAMSSLDGTLDARYDDPESEAADDCVGGGCIELRIVGMPDPLYGRLEYVGNLVASDDGRELVGHVRTATVMTNAVDCTVSKTIATYD